MRRAIPARILRTLAPALACLAACSARHEGAPELGEPVPAAWARALPPATGEFTTLSYNVAGLPQEVSKVNPKAHIPLISPLLNDYDVVLTQEDFDWWQPGLDRLDFARYHERLREKADHPWRSGRHPGPGAAGIVVPTHRPFLQVGDGLGLLSRFPFQDLTRVAWKTFGPDGSDGLAMKGFAMARVELAPGVSIDVYNLHADAGGGQADEEARKAGFEQLARYMEECSTGRAVILGGDTNLHTSGERPDKEVWGAFLERTGLTDVHDAVEAENKACIDKFAFRDGAGVDLTPLRAAFESERFRDAASVPLSDHEPLAVRWRWTATGE